MCELVGVSKSGYYNWLGRPEAATKVRRRKLALLVESEFKASDMILRVPAPRRRSEAQGHRRVPRHASAPLMREKGPVSRWAAPQGSAPPHRAGRHRRPPRPGGQGLPPPRPPGSNGSGTSPTSARGSDSCIWPLFWTAATRESRRLRHGRQHEDRPDLQGHRVWPCAAAPTRRRSRSSTRGRGSQYTS